MNRTHLFIAVVGLAACDGAAKLDLDDQLNPGGPALDPFIRPLGDPNAPDACEGIPVAASPTALRRLTVEEQVNSYRDMLNDQTLSPSLADQAGPIITEVEVDRLNLAVADMVADQGHLDYLPCDPAGPYNTTCASTFIAEFGRMAFRRPLTDAEKSWLRTEVFDAVRNHPELSPAATFREAIDATAQVILQAPQTLYVHETGVADPSLPAGVRRLTGYERATRLSYLLWGTTPDEQLLAAAGAGELDTAEGVRAQADRLLSSPRARGAVKSFVSRWLELDGNSHQASLEEAPKDPATFPFDGPTLRAAMRQELTSFYEDVFFNQGGSFQALMTSPRAYVNKTLGELYGLATPPSSDSTFSWVNLDTTERAGMFTRAGFLALYAPQKYKSPIRRGVFMLRDALCQPLGAPPADVDNTPLKPTGEAMSVRDQVEVRTSPASCQSCHARIDPLGFTLENYDAIGRFETSETGVYNGTPYSVPVDAVATPLGTDLTGPISGGVALSQQLAQSGMAKDCVALTWFEQAHDRKLYAADACNMQRAMRKFRATDDMRDLVLTLASDESAQFIQLTQ
jgi:hypothetical protein